MTASAAAATGAGRRQRLHERGRESLAERREDRDVEEMVEISRIRSQPTEVRPRTDATPFGERLERPARLTVTEEDEMHSRPASRENGCRLEKRGVILHGRETRDDSDDDRVSRNTQ